MQELTTTTSAKVQENTMQRKNKMMKRARKERYVAESPCTETQGTCNIIYSTDPSNNVPEDVSVRKRRAGDDGEMPLKRRRCSNLTISTEHSDGSVEDTRIKRCKRKASVDAGPSEKKCRCSINNTTTTNCGVEDPSVELNEGKASDDREAPDKNISCSDSSSSHASFILVPNFAPARNIKCSHYSFIPIPSYKETLTEVKSNESSDIISHNFSSASPEEEKIFEMSSSGNTNKADFEDKYCQLAPIGSGGFGSVYEGFRKSDCLPVAIKHIPIETVCLERVSCNGKVYKIILEVAFMLKAAGLPGSVGQSAAVSLQDWYILDEELILVMERPVSSTDLYRYRKSRKGSLDESEAKMILKQLVDAAIDMHSKGVFHRDIKLQNVLVQLDSDAPRVRLIDFGCGSFSTEESYSSFCGTRSYFPPEWFDCDTYWARPTTVWQLGAVFYSLLSGHMPFTTMDFIHNHIQINKALSVETKTLLNLCLAREPLDRVTLEELKELLAF